MDELILDPIIDKRDLLSLVQIYRSSRAGKELIDNNLDKIQRVFDLRGLTSFRDIVEAYEQSIIDLPFQIGLLKAVKYSPKLVQRVIDDHPFPFYDDGRQRDAAVLHYTPEQLEKRTEWITRRVHYSQNYYGERHDTSYLNFSVLKDKSARSELMNANKYYDDYYQTIIDAMKEAIISRNEPVLTVLVKRFNEFRELLVRPTYRRNKNPSYLEDKKDLIKYTKDLGREYLLPLLELIRY